MATPLKAPPYGRDTSATDQVHYGVIVSGAKLVVENILRLLRTPKGTLLDDLFWGYSLADRLGSAFSQRDADAVPGELEAEISKDDRVDVVTVTAVMSTIGAGVRRLKLTIDVELAAGVTFSMVLAYQDLTIEVFAIDFGGGAS